MSTTSSFGRPRVLATVRHSGPAHTLAGIVRATRDWHWTIAVAGVGARTLVSAHADLFVLPSVRLVAVDPATGAWVPVTPRQAREAPDVEVDLDDGDGAQALLADLSRLVKATEPDLVVRTTPSTGIGPDELVATAAAGVAPVACVQDFYGTGTALDAVHPVASCPPTAIGTVDTLAALSVSERTGRPADVVGWIAHERFLGYPSYRATRSAARRQVGISPSGLLILIVGGSRDVPLREELAVLASTSAVGADPALRDRAVFAYRPHPRRPTGNIDQLDAVFQQSGVRAVCLPGGITSPALLAVADVIVSRASVMNLEATAYAATGMGPVPLSVYVSGSADTPLFDGYWGSVPPPTHTAESGSLITDVDRLPGRLARALDADTRGELAARAQERYGPRGAPADLVVRKFLGALL